MLTPRESVLMDNERDEARLMREHALRMKEMELELHREEHTAELLQKQLEAKWASWLKIPIIIVKMPVYLLLGLSYIVTAIRGGTAPTKFWEFISK